jgi:DHA2 family multidrug resistance protein-like MFS transporter
MSDATPTDSVRAGRREWIGLVVLALPTLLIALDVGVLFLALPHLSADLGATSVQQLWIADIYGFLTAGFLITMGNLGDRVGRRKLLLIGAAAFGAASVLAALSTTPEMLIIARAVMGVAAATLGPSTLSLISNMFRDERQRGVAIAAWVSCLMAGSALGPVVGGLLLAHFWWGSVFLLAVPVMVLLLVAGPILLPEYKNPAGGKLDPTSVALSLAAILPVIYGLKELAVDTGLAVVPVLAIVVGLTLGVLFVRRQNRLPQPLLDLKLFANRAFSATLTAMLLGAAAMAGMSLLVSQYIQTVLGYSSAEAGLWLMPTGVAIALGSQFAPALARRISPSAAITGGLALGAVGFALIAFAGSSGDSGLALVVAGNVIFSLGAGPLYALGAHLVVGSVPPERAGSAASMSETSNYFGSTLGLAVIGTIGAAVYRGGMADVAPAGVPGPALDTARDTLAGASVTAQNLPPGPGGELLHAANDAFTSGLNVAGVIGAVLFVGLGIVVAVANRTGRTPAAQPGDAAHGDAAREDAAPEDEPSKAEAAS